MNLSTVKFTSTNSIKLIMFVKFINCNSLEKYFLKPCCARANARHVFLGHSEEAHACKSSMCRH